jgi:hypothetical protein
MLINDLASTSGPDVYYDQKFRVVLEDHMTFLRQHPQTTMQQIKFRDAFKFEGDLSGLLYELSIPIELHWLVMRMNYFTSPVQNDETLKSVLVPEKSVIERLRSVYLNKNKIKN